MLSSILKHANILDISNHLEKPDAVSRKADGSDKLGDMRIKFK